jgi:prepilin-type N-terminal cleavage/methylation domain-containing protein
MSKIRESAGAAADSDRGESMQSWRCRANRRLRGFSLTELLVVIAIATLLLSIVFVMGHGLYKVVRSFMN